MFGVTRQQTDPKCFLWGNVDVDGSGESLEDGDSCCSVDLGDHSRLRVIEENIREDRSVVSIPISASILRVIYGFAGALSRS